jgi:hypothetical protein
LHFPSGEEIWLAAFKLEFENDEVGVEKVWESGVNDKAFAKVMFSCTPTPFHTLLHWYGSERIIKKAYLHSITE